MRTNAELIGRDDVNDFDSVLAVVGREESDGRHLVTDHCDAEFTWDYKKGRRPQLDKLYEKAKRAQWNGQTDLPWDTEVDQERSSMANAEANIDADALGQHRLHRHRRSRSGATRSGSASASRTRTGCSPSSCTASRARSCARPRSSRPSRGSTPSTTPPPRSIDEARHVEVFAKYLDEKLSGHYPVNAHLGLLLDDIIATPAGT